MTTYTFDKSFSSLKRIETYLWYTMELHQLNGLTLLDIHPEIDITPKEIVNTFAIKHQRRIQLL